MNKTAVIIGSAVALGGIVYYLSRKKQNDAAGGFSKLIDERGSTPRPGPNPTIGDPSAGGAPDVIEPATPPIKPSMPLVGNQRGRVVSIASARAESVRDEIRSGQRTAGTVLVKDEAGRVLGAYDSDKGVSTLPAGAVRAVAADATSKVVPASVASAAVRARDAAKRFSPYRR